MSKKRFQQVLVFCIVVLGVLYIAVGVTAIKRKRERDAAPPATVQTVSFTNPTAPEPTDALTDAPTAQQPSVTIDNNISQPSVTMVPTASNPDGSVPSSDTVPQTPVIPATKAQIIAAYVNAVNQLKATGTFTLTKNDQLNVVIDEMEPASVRSIADKMIANSQNQAAKTYQFSAGSDPTSGASVMHVVAPIDKYAALSESAVRSASATPVAGGGYRIQLTLGREQQTMTTPAPNYSTVMEVLDPDTLGLPSGSKLDAFTITYDGGTIDATLDAQGRITSMTHHLIVPDAQATGSYMVPVTLRMHGDHTATYSITY